MELFIVLVLGYSAGSITLELVGGVHYYAFLTPIPDTLFGTVE